MRVRLLDDAYNDFHNKSLLSQVFYLIPIEILCDL